MKSLRIGCQLYLYTIICDTHFIRAVVLEEGTLQHMRLVIQCVADYEDAFRRALGAKRSGEAKKELSAKKRTLQKSENRLAELDRLFKRIYEDMVNGKLSEARFQMLADDYEQEQAELRAKIEMLENEIQNQEDQAENVDRFIPNNLSFLPGKKSVAETFSYIVHKCIFLPPVFPYLLLFLPQLPEVLQLHRNDFYAVRIRSHQLFYIQYSLPTSDIFHVLLSPLENIFSTSESNSKIQLLCVPDIPFEFLSRISVNLFADFHQGILYRRIYFSQPLKEADTHINTVKITVFPHL